ncbi:MAG: polar amino acid transport system substrate-binding protein [Actinomycetota bacterium]|jgi:polar amino acid transport system substrate-binding protein|nr:polar amino acid transport system substrate-binding protein [Actinomycetota bacterium]
MNGSTRRWVKLIAVLGMLAMVFAACGKDETPTPSGGDTQSESPGGDSTNFTLKTEGRLTVGSDIPYPPFEFNDDSGALTGFDVEITREIASRLGLENEDNDWLSVNFDTIFTQLQTTNKFDIVVAAVTGAAPDGSPASETVADRLTHVDFTTPYYPSLQSLTVDTSANPDIKSVEDLPDGARVAVQQATTGAFYAEENLTNVELVQFPKAPGMYQALEAGQVVAVFNDLPVSLDAIDGKPDLQVVKQVETGEEYAIAVNKENTALKDAINSALEEMFSDGTYAEIFTKYFPDQELPSYASE